MQEIVKNIFVATHFRGPTVSAILTEEGYVLIDAPPFPEDARRWKALLYSHEEAPFRAMIMTDPHPERLLGANLFEPDVLVAHRHTYEYLKSLPGSFVSSVASQISRAHYETSELSGGKIWLPTVTFDQAMVLHFGNITLHLEYRPGPTRGSIWVKDLKHRILFAGDIVVVGTAPYLNSQHSNEWLNSLHEINAKSFPSDIIISGHGNITVKTATDSLIQFLDIAHERIDAIIETGQSMSDTGRLVHELLNLFPPPLESELADAQHRVRTALQAIYNEKRQRETNSSPDIPPDGIIGINGKL